MDLKNILKYIKLHEQELSIVLGVVILIIAGIFVGKYIANLRHQNSITQQAADTTNENKTYTVTKGDSLWKIAKKVLGNGNDWKQIADANNISNPSQIEIGQILTIPSLTFSATPTPTNTPTPQITKEAASTNNNITQNSYTVVKGDNLWNIAIRAYGDGTKWHQIAEANHLTNPRMIHTGNVFTIPR
ncbi:MAG TPA: LysM peptidoglycan-binding domain-containing protein [Patescibacteria group bacterium]|nr:LysM peptidoglycan-binding domain-containing protein [Patescibacteria group bacterium]